MMECGWFGVENTANLEMDPPLGDPLSCFLQRDLAAGGVDRSAVAAVAVHRLPPLRERRSDLPLLLQHFIRMFTAPASPFPTVSPVEGNRNRTAAILGISRKTLWEKLRYDRVLPSTD
jgi:transcriptional regulator with AAA-type ATPase domain